MNASEREASWGRDITLGASVTSKGRHGAGQPAVFGVVIDLPDAHTARVQSNSTTSHLRSVRNLRRVDTDTEV